MTTIPAKTQPLKVLGGPAWDIAGLFPDQGAWTEEEYFALGGNHLIESSDGLVEVLPLPDSAHQGMVGYLYRVLAAIVKPAGLGKVLFSPMPVRLWHGKIREPDIVLMLNANRSRALNQYWIGADLAMEVVSNDDRRRDLEIKREEYAKGGILEYWIVDPRDAQITVLKLEGERYTEHGIFSSGQIATSALLPDFSVDVSAAFAAAND